MMNDNDVNFSNFGADEMKNIMKNPNMSPNLILNIPKDYFVIFRKENTAIKIPFKKNEKISNILEKYRKISSNYDTSYKFIFNTKVLNQNLTAAETGLENNSNIFVVHVKK